MFDTVMSVTVGRSSLLHAPLEMVRTLFSYNPDFKVTIIQRQITQKQYKIEPYLQWQTNRKSYRPMIYRKAPISMFLKDKTPTPGFKVTPFFDAEYLRMQT